MLTIATESAIVSRIIAREDATNTGRGGGLLSAERNARPSSYGGMSAAKSLTRAV
jgi:hypothetical protein